ncbi:substrate-binding domain-containing protein [Edaphobacter modestus]|uniref:Monosaccharide ABC transporter substrate-binding protein (CUT2 family) n=1 Tax=Edaphobacter modestus TaxID=388466 RepID=A0A4Q7Z0T4_9BACT|nr:substrate-binding domain-containing protein [Edaphobacter modestus]RZU43089.1 monosaccharide ABC transporter substrate-binding protein (CUT2 family) [Edaphobacter modestus]
MKKHSYGNSNQKAADSAYSVQAVERACSILKCFRQRSPLTLSDIVKETKLSRTTAFRLLATLVDQGMLERPAKNQYRAASDLKGRNRHRIGYASQSEEFSFSRLVSDSIRSQAYEAGIELLELSNRYSPTIAVRNAEIFVREQVDLVIEFQTNEQSASIIASKLIEADIPLIAIDIPHPGANYYGANNYRAGLLAGRSLAEAAIQQWRGQVDEVLLLELPMAGPLPRSRLTGVLAGIREIIPKFQDQKVRFLDGKGRFESSLQVTRRYLQRVNTKHVLISALNDPSCLGALHAFEEAGRGANCLAVGHNASIEARREMQRSGSRLIGSVAYFPERYGDAVIALALDKLQGKDIPPATFVRHQMITPNNVSTCYPNDKLIRGGDGDSLLYSWH